MIYRIVQYIQPWEIDDLDRQADQLIRGSYFIEAPKNVVLDVTMNLEIVNWNESSLPKEYFVNKYRFIKTKLEKYFTVEFDTDCSIRGCTDKRRSVVDKIQDYIIWLDSDIFFAAETLSYLIKGTEQVTDDYYIISPEIIKYWDTSWDCITAQQFLDKPFNLRDSFDMYSLGTIVTAEDVYLRENSIIKFGGGWFTLFTDSFFKKITLIPELGAYAPDDTYVSYCGMKLGIPQYILAGVVVSEIGKRLLENKDYIRPLLNIKIRDKQKISDKELLELIQSFYEQN
jgi:hypothetical protein